MKTPLVLLLALSLAGNAVLAVMALRSGNLSASSAVAAGTSSAAAKSGVAQLTSAGAAPSPAPAFTAATWPAFRPNGNLKTLVANLRAAGFPPSVIRAVTQQMISEQVGAAGQNLPFWKQTAANPEYLAEQQQLGARKREMFEDLLGADAKPSATIDPASRERRYGQLSDDKVDKIEALNRDISDLRSKMFAERKSGDYQSLASAQAAAAQEQHAELAAILTPDELTQYEMRSSPAADRVMANLKGLDVSETEYAALFSAQKAYDAADPVRTGTLNADSIAARATAQDQLNEQARAVLTDDRFYDYLKSADPAYGRNAQFAANYPNITPAMTYQLTQMEREYQTSMIALARASTANGTTIPSADRMAQLMAARNDYQNKLSTLLGPEVATAFQQRNRGGGITTATNISGRPPGN